MGSATPFAAAARGNCCPMICHLGVPSIITSGPGAAKGSGSKSMTLCANGYERRPDGKANPAAQFWTANRCEPVNKEAFGATMGQETVRAQASPAGGYAGIGAAGNGNRSQCARPQ